MANLARAAAPSVEPLAQSMDRKLVAVTLPSCFFPEPSQLITICRLSLFGHVWHEGYEPFARQGSDTFIIVSAGGNILWTCDPETILQFSKRSHDFVKPVEMMGMLNMYGPTVTATEGDESRRYRKIAAPSFNDRTHGSTWTESLGQAAALLKRWDAMQSPIMQLNADMASLTLHVISYVCFDRQIGWAQAVVSQDDPPEGHHMSYREAISSMVDNIPTLFIVPPPVLSKWKKCKERSLLIEETGISPLDAHKKAKASYSEWLKYMEEMQDETLQSLRRHGSRNDASILGEYRLN